MSPDQETHLKSIQEQVAKRLESKYRAGAKEHQEEAGGKLWLHPTLSLVDFTIDEAIDQLAYLYTLREKIALL